MGKAVVVEIDMACVRRADVSRRCSPAPEALRRLDPTRASRPVEIWPEMPLPILPSAVKRSIRESVATNGRTAYDAIDSIAGEPVGAATTPATWTAALRGAGSLRGL